MLAAAAIIAILALVWHLRAAPASAAAPSNSSNSSNSFNPFNKTITSPFSYGADWTSLGVSAVGAASGTHGDAQGANCNKGSVPEAAPGFVGVSAPIAWGTRNEVGAYGANVIGLAEAEVAFDSRLPADKMDLAPEPTVRDGTVAPLSRKSVPNMVRAGLGARSAAVAAYRDAPDPTDSRDLGLGRLVWARAAGDRQARAAGDRQARAEADRQGRGTWRGAPLPGTLVRLDTRTGAESDWSNSNSGAPKFESSARPMSLPSWHLEAAGADPRAINPDYVTDGPFGAAMAFAAR